MSGSGVSAEEVRRFYDDFLQSRMLLYRLHGSPRIDAALRFIESYVSSRSQVLDLGCGIGIATERLARRARHGRVWGCDISPANIWYARKTVNAGNVSFFSCDMLDDFESIRRKIDAQPDVITLLDVVEHLPGDRHAELFRRIREIAAPEAIVAFTYPSPAYQSYLREFDPDELQPIDEIVEISELIEAAQPAGFGLLHYSVHDLDYTGQYVHCAFRLEPVLKPVVRTISLPDRARAFAHKYFRLPLRRRRFLENVFPDDPGGSP